VLNCTKKTVLGYSQLLLHLKLVSANRLEGRKMGEMTREVEIYIWTYRVAHEMIKCLSINKILISITMLETNIQKERPLHGDLSSVCCLNLQFKTNIKEWHLLNGLRIMRYHSAMVSFLMRHISTLKVKLINKMCNFWRQRIHLWFMRRCILHWELQCGSPSQVMDC
jgi:hypothetical protein